MKVLRLHHLQKIQLQRHPTRGCHYPRKQQIIHLTGGKTKICSSVVKEIQQDHT